MEPVNCVARVKDGLVEVWCGTQSPSLAKWKAAQVAGVGQDKVTLHVPYLGGGFGRRLEVDMVEQAVRLAAQYDVPVIPYAAGSSRAFLVSLLLGLSGEGLLIALFCQQGGLQLGEG